MKHTVGCLIAPLPLPVTGFTKINQLMVERLSSLFSTVIFDAGPLIPLTTRILNLVRYLRLLLCSRIDWVYIALHGGLRQWIDIAHIIPAVLSGKPVFVHHHTFSYIQRESISFWVIRKLTRGCVHVVLCEEHAARLAAIDNWENVNIIVVSNAAFQAIPPITRSVCLASTLRIGYFSSISKEKGFGDFIRVIEHARSLGIECEALAAGPISSNYFAEYSKITSKIPCYKYAGELSGESILEFLSNIDILLFPSTLQEAEPVSIIEALACGCMVLAKRRGCIGCMSSNKSIQVYSDDEYFSQSLNFIVNFEYSDRASYSRIANDAYEDLRKRGLIGLDRLINRIQTTCF